jgi:hypothetical protein
MVKIKVKNIGDAPTTFDGDNQTMINKTVRSSPPTLRSTSTWRTKRFLEEINPGNQVTGALVFDIPKKSTPAKPLLKAGVFGFSEGVIVDVS